MYLGLFFIIAVSVMTSIVLYKTNMVQFKVRNKHFPTAEEKVSMFLRRGRVDVNTRRTSTTFSSTTPTTTTNLPESATITPGSTIFEKPPEHITASEPPHSSGVNTTESLATNGTITETSPVVPTTPSTTATTNPPTNTTITPESSTSKTTTTNPPTSTTITPESSTSKTTTTNPPTSTTITPEPSTSKTTTTNPPQSATITPGSPTSEKPAEHIPANEMPHPSGVNTTESFATNGTITETSPVVPTTRSTTATTNPPTSTTITPESSTSKTTTTNPPQSTTTTPGLSTSEKPAEHITASEMPHPSGVNTTESFATNGTITKTSPIVLTTSTTTTTNPPTSTTITPESSTSKTTTTVPPKGTNATTGSSGLETTTVEPPGSNGNTTQSVVTTKSTGKPDVSPPPPIDVPPIVMAFGADLIRFYYATGNNSYQRPASFSPYSVQVPLSELAVDAEGQTANDMDKVLRRPLGDNSANQQVLDYLVNFARLVEPCGLILPGAIFNYTPDGFKDQFETGHSMGDGKNPNDSINLWFTNQATDDIVLTSANSTTIGHDFRSGIGHDLVTASAAYYNASFKTEFHPTPPIAFNDPTIGPKLVKSIDQAGLFRCQEFAKKYSTCEIPLKSANSKIPITMYVVKPANGSGLDSLYAQIDDIIKFDLSTAKMETRYIRLPIFTVDTTVSLDKQLSEMNLGGIFKDGAKFRGYPGAKVWTSLHRTFITTDRAYRRGPEVTRAGWTPWEFSDPFMVFITAGPHRFIVCNAVITGDELLVVDEGGLSPPPDFKIRSFSDLAKLDNDFSIRLIKTYAKLNGNLDRTGFALSPHIIFMLMSMIEYGARGKTAAELNSQLQLTLRGNNATQDYMRHLVNFVDNHNASGLNVATQVSGVNIQSSWIPDYVRTLNRIYGIQRNNIRLGLRDKSAHRSTISLYSHPVGINPSPIFNYYTTENRHVFLPSIAQLRINFSDLAFPRNPITFTPRRGKKILVDSMGLIGYFRCGHILEGYSFCVIPLQNDSFGNHLNMLLVQPPRGTGLRGLYERFDEIIKYNTTAFPKSRCYIEMPVFSVDNTMTLNSALKKMNLSNIFNVGTANFEGMSSNPRTAIRGVVQRATVRAHHDYATDTPATSKEVRWTFDAPFIAAITTSAEDLLVFNAAITLEALSRDSGYRESRLTNEEIIRYGNDFAINLTKALTRVDPHEPSFCLSPYPIFLQMSMLGLGAREKTEREIYEALGVSLLHHPGSQERFKHLVDSVDALDSRSTHTSAKTFHGNNLYWNTKYNGIVSHVYGSQGISHTVKNETELEDVLNRWATDSTGGDIQEISENGREIVLDSTDLLLASVAYYEANYGQNFSRIGRFIFTEYGRRSMNVLSVASINYFRCRDFPDKYSFCRIPLQTKSTSADSMHMILIKPSFGKELASINQWLHEIMRMSVATPEVLSYIQIPLFHVGNTISFNNALKLMNSISMFGSTANFTGMTGSPKPRVNKVIQNFLIDAENPPTYESVEKPDPSSLPAWYFNSSFMIIITASVPNPLILHVAHVNSDDLEAAALVMDPEKPYECINDTAAVPTKRLRSVNDVTATINKFGEYMINALGTAFRTDTPQKGPIFFPVYPTFILSSMLSFGARGRIESELVRSLGISLRQYPRSKRGLRTLIDRIELLPQDQLNFRLSIIYNTRQQRLGTFENPVRNTFGAQFYRRTSSPRVQLIMLPENGHGKQMIGNDTEQGNAPENVILLVSETSFNAHYAKPFRVDRSKEFSVPSGGKITADVMVHEGYYRCGKYENRYSICELPLKSTDPAKGMTMRLVKVSPGISYAKLYSRTYELITKLALPVNESQNIIRVPEFHASLTQEYGITEVFELMGKWMTCGDFTAMTDIKGPKNVTFSFKAVINNSCRKDSYAKGNEKFPKARVWSFDPPFMMMILTTEEYPVNLLTTVVTHAQMKVQGSKV